MPIDVACQCGARFRASDRLAGRQVACPRCAGSLSIPAADEGLEPIQRSDWAGAHSTASTLPASTVPATWATATAEADGVGSRSPWLSYDFTPKLPTWHVAVGALFALAGVSASVLIMVACSIGIDRASETSSWHQTQGQITSAKATAPFGLRRRGNRNYHVNITYAYRVGDAEYVSSRVSGVETGEDGRQIVRRYPAGATVPVYYNPANPSEAVLEAGVPGRMWIYVVASIASALGATVAGALCGLTLLSRLR
jgi:hypothetical protein